MAIQFYLTDAGRNAVLSAASLGLNVSLTHIAIGTSKYNPETASANTTLVTEVERYPLNGGSVEPSSHTLRFIANIEPTITTDGFEIGLITSTGVLFAIASTTGNDPLIRLVANIVSIATFGMVISNVNLSNVIINIDPNTPISVALMNEHLAHLNPHPQYVLKNEVGGNNNSLSEKFFPYYSCIITSDINYNPAVALQELLEENTKWRKLPFIPHGVSSSSDVGKISHLENGADIAALGMFIWQRMPDNWVQPTAMIYYAKSNYHASPQAPFGLLPTHYDQFGFNDSCLVGSYYVIKMTAANDIPTRYKLVSKGKIVDAVFKDASGLLHVDEDGFGLIPVRRKLLSAPVYGLDPTKIELVLLGQYQHVCSQSDQKYRFLDDVTHPDAVAEISVDASKKYLRSNEVIEFNIVRTETAVETLYLAFIHLALSSGNSIAKDRLGAVGYFYLQESSSAGVALEDAVGGTGDDIYRLDFAENETEKKVVLVLRDVSILKRMNVAACVSDISSASFLDRVFFDNFLIEKNTVQANYMLTYTILGTTLTISLDTTLVAENTIVEWNISNFTGDPIAPSDTTGEFTIDEDGHAEVAFTFNLGDEFSFEFGLTGREEYVGVKRE